MSKKKCVRNRVRNEVEVTAKRQRNRVSVYHLSATENTLRQMPKFNPYQTGHGIIGDTKYNRRKEKEKLRKLLSENL